MREPTGEGVSLSRGGVAAVLIAVCVAQVALAMPAVLVGLLQRDLGASGTDLTWFTDAFLVPVTLFELTFGVIGDLFGRRRLIIGGALLLAIGEVVAVLAPGTGSSTNTNMTYLWVGQALAGVGCAAVFPTSLAMIASGGHATPGHGRSSIPVYAAALSSGGFISPVLGGLLTKAHWGSDPAASWRWPLVTVAAIAVASALISFVFVADSSSPKGRTLDWGGQVSIALSVFGLLFGVIQGPTAGWASAEVIVSFVVAAGALLAFVALERRHASPLLRLDLFRNRAFALVSLVTVVGMFAFLGTAAGTSARLTIVQGMSPLKASLAFVLLQGFALALLPLLAYLTPRVNPRWLLAGGFALMAAGDFLASTASYQQVSLTPLIIPMALVGIGFAFAVSSVITVAVGTVRPELVGMASATTSQLRDLGFTLGPAIVQAVALGDAAHWISSRVNASASLQHQLASFYGSVAHAPAAARPALAAAIGAVKSGPYGANGVPATTTLPNGQVVPLNPLQGIAFHGLGTGYGHAYFVCGCAAAASALIIGLVLRSSRSDDPAADPAEDNHLGIPTVEAAAS